MKRMKECASYYTIKNRHRKITQSEAMCFALASHLDCYYSPQISKRWYGYKDECPLSQKMKLYSKSIKIGC